MKRLICAKDVEALEKEGKKVFYIDKNTIITPAAKDAAKICGIEFSLEENCCAESKPEPVKTCDEAIDSNLIFNVLKALADKGLLQGILDNISAEPYIAEQDSSGLKLVRGSSVKYEYFDTGNPKNKVYYRQLIGKGEASVGAGFLTIENSSFEWEMTYEELDYVIEGTLTVTINGKTYTGHPGDVFYVPAGAKVVWGSPDKAKVFCVTYPAL